MGSIVNWAQSTQERLYFIRFGLFVQYDGNGRKPAALDDYVSRHEGRFPPYIPLPCEPTEFELGDPFSQPRRIRWTGKGRLPEEILEYVCENKTLPPHEW